MYSDLISIIIPTYNRGNIVSKTLQSVMSQTYQNWECLVVDDGSTDNTEDVVNKFVKSDKRFSFFRRPLSKPKGANSCRNFGFSKSKGSYINFLDSDDIFLPQKLELQVKALQVSGYPFSICQTNIWNEQTQEDQGLRSLAIISPTPLDDYIQFRIFWSIQAPLWKREVIENYKFDESLQQSQEYDYHIRILAKYKNYHATEEVLTTIISHSDNMSLSRTDRMDKFISNLNVRFSTLKKLNKQLLPETKTYLFSYFLSFFKIMVLKRDFEKAFVCLQRIRVAIHYVDDYNGQKFKYIVRWSLAIPAFLLFRRGDVFLKTL